MRIEAAYGFTMMLNKLIADEKPTHVIAAFDKGLPGGARRDVSRSTRRSAPRRPTSCASSSRSCAGSSALYAIPIVEIDGEEADDVIATLARQARRAAARSARRHRRPRPPADRRRPHDGADHASRDHRARPLRRGEGARALRPRAAPAARLPRPQGRSVRQPARHPRRRREDRDQAGQDAGSLDALLANPKLAGTPKLEALVREHGEQARVCRDVSVIKRDLALDAGLGGRAVHARRRTTRSTRSTASSSSRRCSRSSQPPETPQRRAERRAARGRVRVVRRDHRSARLREARRADRAAAQRERVAVARRGELYAVAARRRRRVRLQRVGDRRARRTSGPRSTSCGTACRSSSRTTESGRERRRLAGARVRPTTR